MSAQVQAATDWIPVLNRQFRLQWEEAQQCYVLLYPEGMVKLNLSAGEILALCDGTKCVSDIIEELTERFPDAPDIGSDVQEFFVQARQNRWLNHD